MGSSVKRHYGHHHDIDGLVQGCGISSALALSHRQDIQTYAIILEFWFYYINECGISTRAFAFIRHPIGYIMLRDWHHFLDKVTHLKDSRPYKTSFGSPLLVCRRGS